MKTAHPIYAVVVPTHCFSYQLHTYVTKAVVLLELSISKTNDDWKSLIGYSDEASCFLQ